jgi:hypothetical protein
MTIEQGGVRAGGTRRNTLVACVILIIFMLFVSLTNDSNPFSTAYPDIDSCVFRYIGIHILQGQMPYVDFFDHKGPLMYIINTFAAFITPGEWGLFIVETCALITAALASYFTCRRFASNTASLVATLLAYGTLGRSIFGGNYVEEYALPLIAIALLCFSSYFVRGRLSRLETFIIGFSAGGAFFLRPNLLGAWAVFCIAIIIFMIRDKKGRDILPTVGFALLGFVCLVGPLLLWIQMGGAFSDFIDQYFIFNFQYSGTYGKMAVVTTFFWMFYTQPTLIAALAAGIFALIKSKKTDRRFWACMLGATLLAVAFASMSGRQYEYYLMAWVPFGPVCLAFALSYMMAYIKNNGGLKRVRTALLSVAIVCLAGICLIPNIITGYNYFSQYHRANEVNDWNGKGGVVQTILADSTPEDKLVVCGAECWAFIETGRSSATKYIFQPEDTRLEIRREYLYQDIMNNHPKFVVIPWYYDSTSYLNGLPGYSLVFSNQWYLVYELGTDGEIQ